MRSSTFVLLLLCCCLSEQVTQSPTTLPIQQGSQEDLQSVLSALAELRDELRNTATEVEELKRKLEEQRKRSEEELKDLETSFNKQVENLKRENEGSRVAFSAYLHRSEGFMIGPFNIAIKLVFDKVITNVGNAYNPITGAFTAPVRGVYQFTLHVQGVGSSTAVSVNLLKNGSFIIVAHGHQPDHRVGASNGVSLLLEVGDIITLTLPSRRNIYGDAYRITTFSGHLLFPV